MLLFVTNLLKSQNWKPTGALDATGSLFYLTCAAKVGNNIYVANANQNFAYSADLGKTWISAGLNKPTGTFAAFYGVKDRLYAKMKINTYDTDLYYSKDNGHTWTIDTVGLPRSLTKNGIEAVILIDMGNDYVLAHNYKNVFYKKVDETKWNSAGLNLTIVDVIANKNKWLMVSGGNIRQSTDNGATWTILNTTGLPDKFQGNKICSNGLRFFISNAPADGGDKVYYSDDEGSSWTLTNSSGKYAHANPWVQNLYAVDDYVFAAILPSGFQDAPPFIMSTSPTPNFSIGDVSGLKTGGTTSNLPFFFHIQNKLYTMFWDLYVSEPGFTGSPSAVHDLNANESSILLQPNPADKVLQFIATDLGKYKLEIFSIQGKMIHQQNLESNAKIDISNWSKGVYLIKSTNQQGNKEQIKFIKK